jgi:hypothetical protein
MAIFFLERTVPNAGSITSVLCAEVFTIFMKITHAPPVYPKVSAISSCSKLIEFHHTDNISNVIAQRLLKEAKEKEAAKKKEKGKT